MKFPSVIIIIFFLAICFFVFKDNLSARMLIWGVVMDTKGYSLKQHSFGKSENQEYLELSNGKELVRIIRTIPVDQSKYIADKLFLLSAFFEPFSSPYPEAISNKVVCPDEFKPKELPIRSGKAFKLFAGERLNYGICAKDLITYRSVYAIFNCGHKGVFEISTFSKESYLQDIVNSFSCR